MQTITLGESGLECSRLAYGCWRVTGVINHAPIDDEHEKKGHKAITAAYEAGYTLFDLADIYSDGLVEEASVLPPLPPGCGGAGLPCMWPVSPDFGCARGGWQPADDDGG